MENIIRITLKIIMWTLIIGFGCNLVMQTISYSFYKNAKHMEDLEYSPISIKYNDKLSGYGINLNEESDNIILFFGGSNYIAYNSVGKYGGRFNNPFLAADFYGSQDSKGKMNLKTMQQTAIDLYDWTKENYPNRKVVVIGHSYGTGIAAYIASQRECNKLFLLSAYRDSADLYNKIIPIFWGPAKIFISNNINLKEYAKNIICETYIIGSKADTTLNADLQLKVQECFVNAELKIFDDNTHDEYMLNKDVIEYIQGKL